MTCSYGGRVFSEGSLICMNGREMKCSGGEWKNTGYPCNTRAAGAAHAQLSIDKRLLAAKPTAEQLAEFGSLVLRSMRKLQSIEEEMAAGRYTGLPPGKLQTFSDNESSDSGSGGDRDWNISVSQDKDGNASVTIDNRGEGSGSFSIGGSF